MQNENLKIKAGIAGYGNIGRGVEKALAQCPDMELAAVFTRRNPKSLETGTSGVPVLSLDEAEDMKNMIDVMILCGGSATDLPEQGPRLAAIFNTVDSYDTHARIPEYFAKMNDAAAHTTAIVSAGWDPGLFSLIRMISRAFLPAGEDYAFWGPGVSQGHSDAIRRVEGVRRAIEYTVPVEKALADVRSGARPPFTARQKHTRECYVVPADGADLERIEKEIKAMPYYFSDYDTFVHFVTEEEFLKNHSGTATAGHFIRSGDTGAHRHVLELSLSLESNAEFTGNILAAYARAAARMAKEGNFGAKTVFDVPSGYLALNDRETLIKELL